METQIHMNIEEQLDDDTRRDRVKLMTNDSTQQTIAEVKTLYKRKMDTLHSVCCKFIIDQCSEETSKSVERCEGQR